MNDIRKELMSELNIIVEMVQTKDGKIIYKKFYKMAQQMQIRLN